MTERLLQYIWQFQYYNNHELTTTEGDQLVIIHPGNYNIHQGPDFIDGRVRINNNIWVGNIELHIFSSDWRKHSHSHDPNYSNVILHVVWSYDELEPGQRFPTLLLSDRVPKVLLQQYYTWMESGQFIPCQSGAGLVEDLIWTSWKERMMVERLERKSEQVINLLRKNNFHWEEMLWRMVARNFGLYVNADAFGELAESIPYNLLLKHRMQIHQLEALLFGQTGLLEEDVEDSYHVLLKKEYVFLQSKYNLQKIHFPLHFLRMRPACFPTVRLAQLAMLVHTSENICSALINGNSVKEVRQLLEVTASDYWHYRYRFGGEPLNFQPKTLGTNMINGILVNSFIPVLFAYGKHHNEISFQQKAVDWMSQVPAESNSVITKFRGIGIRIKNAFDTQALIELKSQYCDKRKCLDCAIANSLLKRNL
jgi:hypothetical protein